MNQAIDLCSHADKHNANFVFSPFSLSMALSTAYTGSRGNTEAQIARALHTDLGQESFLPRFKIELGQALVEMLTKMGISDADSILFIGRVINPAQ